MKNRIHPITMPKWGIEMQEGTITAWHAEVGRALGKGDALLDVETEKIVNSVESPVAGTLRRILADAGETQPVGGLIAVYADADVGDAEIDAFIASFKGADSSFEPDSPAAAPSPAAEPAAPAAADGESKVSPIARRIAERLGVDVTKIQGTGRHGRVSKEDVEAYAVAQGLMAAPGGQAPAAPVAPSNEPTREKMTSMRLTIARRLTESKQSIPHYRLSADVDCAALAARRAELAAAGTRVSLNDLLLRALALTLVEHRDVNAQYSGDEVLKFPHADVCVAVATEGGLTTPIVRAADTKDPARIAAEVADLAERARSGRLQREEITGGTFTLSNLGMFGIDRFDAIINPPQVAILAVGAAAERAVVRDGAVAVARMMSLELSCDHRVVDGATGAKFLAALKQRIETGAF
jgi:pyruvate dehydrogenase E2 component (dihydrolipoamide acetyltransferase)